MLKSFTFDRLLRVSLMLGVCYSIAACDSGRPVLTSTGEVMDLTAPEDGFLLLNYWADWCLPCKEEIPELNELQREAKEQDFSRATNAGWHSCRNKNSGKSLTLLVAAHRHF